MKKLLATLIAAGLVSTASAAGVHVEDGWARSTVEGMKMGGAFMKIHNDEAKKDFLVGGSSPVAERVEVHTHVNDNGVMRMREVKRRHPAGSKRRNRAETGQLPRYVHGSEKTAERRRKSTCYPEIQKCQTSNRTIGSENRAAIRHGS